MSKKGYALRVGNEIWVPPDASDADKEAAFAMMTDAEYKRTAARLVRDLRWMVWRMKHPRWAALLDSLAGAESAASRYRTVRSRL